jgi:hypothetical protein
MNYLIFTFLHRRELAPCRWFEGGLVAGQVTGNNIFSLGLYCYLMTKGDKKWLKLQHYLVAMSVYVALV